MHRRFDCDRVVGESTRAAFPGGLTLKDGKHDRRQGWECKPLRDAGDNEITVNFTCFRSRNVAARLLETYGGNMHEPAKHYPMAAAEGFLMGGFVALLDTDTNCVATIAYYMTNTGPTPTQPEFAARAGAFATAMLQSLTKDRIAKVPDKRP